MESSTHWNSKETAGELQKKIQWTLKILDVASANKTMIQYGSHEQILSNNKELLYFFWKVGNCLKLFKMIATGSRFKKKLRDVQQRAKGTSFCK